MSSTRSALAVVCLGMASVLPAQAAYTVFYDEASYLSAVGATRGYTDFAGSPGLVVAGDSFLPGVVFGSCTAPDSVACTNTVLHNSDGITDIANGTAANGVGSLAWRFELVDVQAFAFHFVSGAIESLNFVDRITLALENVGTPGATGFIGIVSTEAIFGAIAVNGSFPGIGLAMALFAQAPQLPPEWRLFVITGFLGGLTTFSTFSAEVVTALQQGRTGWALATAAAHLLGSVAMTLLGLATVAVLRPSAG